MWHILSLDLEQPLDLQGDVDIVACFDAFRIETQIILHAQIYESLSNHG